MFGGNTQAALAIVSSTAYEAVRKDVFAVIPLFVLMGDLIWRSGAAGDLYRICDRTLRRLPGRLAIATIAGNTVFAAVTGVSIASAAAFSRIAYPEMMKVGYKQTFALGTVAGSACLGMLIPPSVLLIVSARSSSPASCRAFSWPRSSPPTSSSPPSSRPRSPRPTTSRWSSRAGRRTSPS
jgi:TRAP-type mannitol/chloroaromatic compound transport system permease large subunit